MTAVVTLFCALALMTGMGWFAKRMQGRLGSGASDAAEDDLFIIPFYTGREALEACGLTDLREGPPGRVTGRAVIDGVRVSATCAPRDAAVYMEIVIDAVDGRPLPADVEVGVQKRLHSNDRSFGDEVDQDLYVSGNSEQIRLAFDHSARVAMAQLARSHAWTMSGGALRWFGPRVDVDVPRRAIDAAVRVARLLHYTDRTERLIALFRDDPSARVRRDALRLLFAGPLNGELYDHVRALVEYGPDPVARVLLAVHEQRVPERADVDAIAGGLSTDADLPTALATLGAHGDGAHLAALRALHGERAGRPHRDAIDAAIAALSRDRAGTLSIADEARAGALSPIDAGSGGARRATDTDAGARAEAPTDVHATHDGT